MGLVSEDEYDEVWGQLVATRKKCGDLRARAEKAESTRDRLRASLKEIQLDTLEAIDKDPTQTARHIHELAIQALKGGE